MIAEFVMPDLTSYANRGEPTGALIGRRITGPDDAREVSKADQPKPSAGRQVTGTLFGMNHSLIAGRKGKKLKAAGATLGYGTGGNIAGAVAGVGAGTLLHEPALSGLAARVGAMAGGLTGQHHAVMRNQAAGRYKPEVSKGLLAPVARGPVKKAPTLALTGGHPSPRKMLLPTVSKALGPQTLETAFHDMRGQRNALATSLESHQRQAGRRESSLRNRTRQRNSAMDRATRNKRLAVAGAGGGLLVGAAGGRMSKAYRSFDPEDARQRRLGAMAAGSALGGGMLASSGGRSITRDTKDARDRVLTARQNGLREGAAQSSYGHAVQEAGKIGIDRAALVRLKPAGKVAGGAALIATSARLMSDRHKKPWR